MKNPDYLYEQRKEQFDHLPGSILFDLARNDSAEWRWRKAAVDIMVDHDFAEAKRAEIADLYREVLADRAAKSEVEDVVETALEGPIAPETDTPPTITGPLFASVTTQTL